MNELQELSQFFKTMGDENRLKMVNLLGEQSRNVGELAVLLDLKEPTVSHHLAKLREMGLVNLRAAGNERHYRLNDPALKRMKQMVQQMDHIDLSATPADDQSWIDALDLDEFDRKVLKDYVVGGKIEQLPSKQKKLLAILRWLALAFEEGVMYTEREVNAILTRYHPDYASLRRDLVDFGFLRRERGGGQYWLTPENE